ncbi:MULTISPECIES: ABC transporter permease subunit [Paenibacillus]|uniref:Urea ABC transporter permease n=1 Tax=Paenibacillus naphthalenovorans TaxID=162209 RepID=A0A0U2L3B8_9BACL|nr:MULTISPECIES: urea ABC transporter permease [Paenibacillus]ALS24322.1 urea ABC transporter permease [Paenibacillus naphthalenovorans]NTZ20424.1 urea ABC transporter permease [Paenibacillus sp. JMULE4]GCL73786.1 urea ABC transporter permease [Paenibacillus naphthalenovorans]SDI53861.1 branched-chain amino acid transport system permease protein [Paenibacillus naphthalenovorans]
MKFRLNAENVIAVLLFAAFILIPLFASAYKVLNVANFMISVFLSLSLALIWGYTGIFSFGQTIFFGIGGYVYGILYLNVGEPSFTPVALVAGVLAAGVVAWILGYFMFYGGVNDVFVGLITLCVTLVLETFMAQTAGSEWKIGDVLLGGYNGINGIPTVSIGFGEALFTFNGNSFYYLVLFLLIAIYLLLRYLVVSRWGYALLAIRENRERSHMFGYNVPKIQTMVFTLSGMIASLGGILYAAWGNYMTPSTMGLAAATLPVVLVAAGGRKNLTAAMVFTLIYSWFSQYLSSSGNQFALVILGVSLLLVVRFVPEGIIVELFKGLDRLFFNRKKDVNPMQVMKEGIHGKSTI